MGGNHRKSESLSNLNYFIFAKKIMRSSCTTILTKAGNAIMPMR